MYRTVTPVINNHHRHGREAAAPPIRTPVFRESAAVLFTTLRSAPTIPEASCRPVPVEYRVSYHPPTKQEHTVSDLNVTPQSSRQRRSVVERWSASSSSEALPAAATPATTVDRAVNTVETYGNAEDLHHRRRILSVAHEVFAKRRHDRNGNMSVPVFPSLVVPRDASGVASQARLVSYRGTSQHADIAAIGDLVVQAVRHDDFKSDSPPSFVLRHGGSRTAALPSAAETARSANEGNAEAFVELLPVEDNNHISATPPRRSPARGEASVCAASPLRCTRSPPRQLFSQSLSNTDMQCLGSPQRYRSSSVVTQEKGLTNSHLMPLSSDPGMGRKKASTAAATSAVSSTDNEGGRTAATQPLHHWRNDTEVDEAHLRHELACLEEKEREELVVAAYRVRTILNSVWRSVNTTLACTSMWV